MQTIKYLNSRYVATYHDPTMQIVKTARTREKVLAKLLLQIKEVDLNRKKHPCIIFEKRTSKVVFRNLLAKGKWTRTLFRKHDAVILDDEYFKTLTICEFVN